MHSSPFSETKAQAAEPNAGKVHESHVLAQQAPLVQYRSKARQCHTLTHKVQGISDAGWTQQEVFNIPNALSMARLVSGPGIAWLILNEQWGLALGSLVISGASDWADG